jgi:hypothetical protein
MLTSWSGKSHSFIYFIHISHGIILLQKEKLALFFSIFSSNIPHLPKICHQYKSLAENYRQYKNELQGKLFYMGQWTLPNDSGLLAGTFIMQ